VSIGDRAAFPQPDDGFRDGTDYGMTYRQWLVGMALQGIIANPHSHTEMTLKQQASHAIEMADSVLLKLEATP
jgi:hypothetical protein